jgi:lipid II:glycine glycyltransferase (peptidoglycan interpeptide bridge formation enzyme)
MLEIDNSKFIFRTKTIWFSDVPFDVTGYDGVAFHACTKNVNLKGFSKEEFTTLVIDLNQDLDSIWKMMSKSDCRQAINKAVKDGVIIRINQDYEIFHNLNREFRDKKEIGEFNLDIDYMKKNGTLFLAEIDGNVISGQFYLNDERNFRWLLGASRRFEVTGEMKRSVSNAYRLIIWEAIKYAKERGIVNFDMGGYYTGKEPDPQKEGINKFKKTFGGQLVNQYIYQKDYSMLYHIGKKMVSLKKLI